MAQPKNRRGSKPAGSRSDGSAAASALGSVWGGGGENTAFPQASAEVTAGTLSSPGEGYDPRAATSARGVLTPSLQAAYTQGPFKDLNWFGKLTHQTDQADAWKMGQAQSNSQMANAKEMDAIDFQHKQDLETIRDSNMTKQEKLHAELTAANTLAANKQAVVAKAGILPTESNQQTFDDTTQALVPSMALQASRAEMEGNRQKANTSGIEADFSASPAGRQSLEASLSARNAAHGIANANTAALTKRAGVFEVPSGAGLIGVDQMTPGVSLMNDPKMASHFDLSTGQPVPYQPGGLRLMLNGKAMKVVPNAGAGTGTQVTPVESPGPGYQNDPSAFPVQQPAPILQPTLTPASMMQQGLGSIATGGKNWLQGLWNRQMGGAQPASASAPGASPMLDPDQAALLDAEAERKRRSTWMTPTLSP